VLNNEVTQWIGDTVMNSWMTTTRTETTHKPTLFNGYSMGTTTWRVGDTSWRHESQSTSSVAKQGRSPLTNMPLRSVQWLQQLSHCIATKMARVLSSVDAICVHIGLSSVHVQHAYISHLRCAYYAASASGLTHISVSLTH